MKTFVEQVKLEVQEKQIEEPVNEPPDPKEKRTGADPAGDEHGGQTSVRLGR